MNWSHVWESATGASIAFVLWVAQRKVMAALVPMLVGRVWRRREQARSKGR